jgi:L,D-transpeptidase catalytic domain
MASLLEATPRRLLLSVEGMKGLWIFAVVALLALGSATPAPRAPEPPRLAYAEPGCPAVSPECDLVLPGRAAPPAALAAPAAPAAGSDIRVVVSLPEQKAWVFRGPVLLATSPVSTGRPGHETPVGRFPILQKQVHHRSNRYSNAPMPYMQRLTGYGIALHAGALPGYPASHGCIRLPHGFARRLYGMTGPGTRVTVTRARPRSAAAAARLA